MNKLLVVLILSFIGNSCNNTHDKISIDKIDLNESKEFFFGDANLMYEANEINTTLNLTYTKEVNRFKYGRVEFTNSKSNSMAWSKIGVLTESINNDKLVGVVLSIEDSNESIAILKELKKINGEPKNLKPVPTENNEGQLLGYAAYVWSLKNNLSIVLSQSYEYTNGKRVIASLIYIVSNKTRTGKLYNNELVVNRLLRTYI
ncbi:hypothetical protein [Flavobacterium sp. J27]|uniref:hypothetical protein n=1 Tax=Flavobacterium sp. J27 TaxID=2060419 RepID=UPI00102F51F4|nr:hypothetical protein [Flavobacterium sp. J27]